MGDQPQRADVVLRPDVVGQRQQADEVGGDHHGRLDPVFAIACSTFSASKRPSTTTGIPTASSRTPESGPVWYIGPTTRWGRRTRPTRALASAATCSVIVAASGEHRRRQLDALGAAGRPRRVHQVGSGWMSAGGSSGGRSEPLLPRPDDAGTLRAAPSDDHRHAGLLGRFEAGGRRLGTDEQHRAPESGGCRPPRRR